MRIDHWKLRTKALLPLLIMAATLVGMVAFGALRLSDISSSANAIIQGRDLGAQQMTRASRTLTLLGDDILAVNTFGADSPEGKAAIVDFQAAEGQARGLLDEATNLLPDKGMEIGKFLDHFAAVRSQAKAAFAKAREFGGIDRQRRSPA